MTLEKYIESKEDLRDAIIRTKDIEGPVFIEVKVRKGIRGKIPALKVDLLKSRNDLMNLLTNK